MSYQNNDMKNDKCGIIPQQNIKDRLNNISGQISDMLSYESAYIFSVLWSYIPDNKKPNVRELNRAGINMKRYYKILSYLKKEAQS